MCLALGRGRPCFPLDSSCPAVLRYSTPTLAFRVRDSHPLWSAFPDRSPSAQLVCVLPFNPDSRRFRLCRFRSPLLAVSSLFLGLLRCFSSPGSPLPFPGDNRASPLLGFPIRTSPAACGCTRLTGAFRSVPRPSSARRAQASPVCSYLLPEPCDTEKLILSLLLYVSRFLASFSDVKLHPGVPSGGC